MDLFYAVSLPDLSYGSSGIEVYNLQILLNAKGYPCGSADGKLGPKTKEAILKAYRDADIPVQNSLVSIKLWKYILNKRGG